MSERVNDREVRKIEKLMRAVGKAWGHAGLAGSPRVIALVCGDDGYWRLVSTEEDPRAVLQPAVAAMAAQGLGPMLEVVAPYTNKERSQ